MIKFIKLIKLNFTKGAILSVMAIYIVINITNFNKSKIFYGDSVSYYAYLPAIIVHNDVTLSFVKENPEKYAKKTFSLVKGPNDNVIIKASCGIAIVLTPFFFMGHVFSLISDYEANGFSIPYKVAIMLGMLVYITIGLFFLGKILKRFFSDLTTGITLLILGAGTNLLCFSTIQAGVSHAYSFVFLIFYIYLVIKWYEKQDLLTTILLGLTGGLIVLIRPNNILILLILIFYDIKSVKDLSTRLIFFIKNYRLIFLMVLFSIVVWIPQFLYWEKISGQFIYNSYMDSQFNFDKPQIINQFFSYRKGWLLYSPLITLAFVGLVSLYKNLRCFFWPTVLLLSINIYVLSSWYAWWFAGSFGSRGYIDIYAMLAFPIAAFTEKIIKWGKKATIIFSVVLILFISLNIVQTIQYARGYIHLIAMTKEAYWSQFLRFGFGENFNNYLLFPNYKNARKGIYDRRLDYTYKDKLMLKNDSLIRIKMEEIRKSEKTMDLVREKALKKGVSVEQMLWLYAQWIFEHELDRRKEQKILK